MSTLLISGWAQPADALAMLAPEAVGFDYSDYATVEESLEALRKFKDIEQVIGWSLGGQLALRAILAGVFAPRQLTLIATPVKFVSSLNGGIGGMDPLTFKQFRDNYAANPARTKTRFHALVAKGDSNASEVLKQLRHHPQVDDISRWLQWLEELGSASLANSDLSRVPPTLIVHGTGDAVVAHGQGEWLAAHLPRARLQLWPDTGHAPHLHDAERLRVEMAEFRAAA